MSELNISQRRKARFLAVQALYQWNIGKEDLSEVESQFCHFNDMTKVDVDYFKLLLHKIPAMVSKLDAHIEHYIDRDITKMNPVDIGIIRLATFEFIHSIEVPYKVVINEALDLAKTFGADESRKYINGILNSLSKELRPIETKPK